MVEIERREATVVPVGRRSLLSWGAVLAGLVLVIALGWLFFLLGSAIGVSVADASDAEAIGEGFGIGATIWMVLSALASYFAGGLLAGRLSGSPDTQVGMLHGVTLWGLVTLASLVLGYWGIAGLLQTGQTLVSGAASAAGSAVSSVASGAADVAGAAWDLGDTAAADQVQAVLAREMSQVAARASAEQGEAVDPEELRSAVRNLEPATLREAAMAIARDDTEAAKQVFARETRLSSAQIDALVSGVAQRVRSEAEQLSETELAQTVERELREGGNAVLGRISRAAGSEVSRQELRRAVASLDADDMAAVARHLVSGDTERAKDVLVARTQLSDEQIDAVVEGVRRETREEIDALRAEVSAAAEQASDYAQAVLWTVFVSSVLALVASLAGGALGASTVERLQAIHVRREMRRAEA